jgi:hypothetical protein
LKQKVSTRQLVLAAAWEDAMVFALALVGQDVDTIKVQWAPSELHDDLMAMQGAVWKARTGVPMDQIYQDLGYAPEEIATWDLPPEAYKVAVPQLWASAAAVVAPSEIAMADGTPDPAAAVPDGSAPPGKAPPPK